MAGLRVDASATVAMAMNLFHDTALSPRRHVSNRIVQMNTKLECINPILIVRDIKVSLDYYVRVLGFEKAEWVTAGRLRFTIVIAQLANAVQTIPP